MSVKIDFKGHIDFLREQKPRKLAFLLFFIYETALVIHLGVKFLEWVFHFNFFNAFQDENLQ